MSQDIEGIHRDAVLHGSTTYVDPSTGFTVFTELSHLRRGKCCGNVCRHCPYGWENVPNKSKSSKLVSGDMKAAQEMLQRIEIEADELSLKDNTGNEITARSGKGGRHGGRHTKKNVPYTRGGDRGTSQLLTGERRSKADDSFEAMGTVDELCSIIGVVHAELASEMNSETDSNMYGELPDWILDVMSRLFDIGSHVAKPQRQYEDGDDARGSFSTDGVGGGFDAAHIDVLEDWIDVLTDKLPELSSFVLPTGGKVAAQLHVARCVCRRAERRVVELVDDEVCDPNAMRYLNRLSDFLFTAARFANFCEGREEIQYKRDYRGAKQRHRFAVSLRKEDEKKQT